jgi:cell wall assembly regulator SMI1
MKPIEAGFSLADGAHEVDVKRAEDAIQCEIPKEYRRFLRQHNGGTGFVGDIHYLELWPVDQIPKHYSGYQFSEFLPSFIPIGSNGAGEAFAIDTSAEPPVFGFVPFGDLRRASFIPLSADFAESIELIALGRAFESR